MGYCDCGEENGGVLRVDIFRLDMECGWVYIMSFVRGIFLIGGGVRLYFFIIMVFYCYLYFYKVLNGVSKLEEFFYVLFIWVGNYRFGFG